MDRRILIHVTAPAVVIGLVLFVTCLVSAWSLNRLEGNLTSILGENVASLEAALELEVTLRQLRFQCFLYLTHPEDVLLEEIRQINRVFPDWLDQASRSANTPEEQEYVEKIRVGYHRYLQEFQRVRDEVAQSGKPRNFRALAAEHPIRHVIDPCDRLVSVNKQMMFDTAHESKRVSQMLHVVMLLLALGGPLSGLIIGYSMALGLSRSIHQLSVRIQDAAQRLDQDVASVSLVPGGDLERLDGQVDHVVARVEEVAERLQRQHRELIRSQQLAAVGQLAASVAHEVRNPLMSIKLLVEAALRPLNPRPCTPDNLRIIHTEIVRLERTVQEFLDFTRPPTLQRAPGDLREVLARALDLVRTRARQQGVVLDAHTPPDPLSAEIDREQFCTVLVNLFLNALDAMPTGGRLEVRLEAVDGQPRLTVADSGPGITPAMLERLFTPFASTKSTGTGLGLCISRRIVEDHGGQVNACNRPEGGACFTIHLPRVQTRTSHAETAGRR